MPLSLDFSAMTAPFQAPMASQLKSIADAFTRLGRWLKPRVATAQRAIEATRDYPVLNYISGALAVTIAPFQRGALQAQASSRTFGQQVRDGGAAFLNGVRYIEGAAREAWLIPGLVATVADIFALVLASIERFPTPTAALFDLRRPRQASDLFGEMGLLARAFIGSTDQIIDLSGRTHSLLTRLRGESGGESTGSQRTAPGHHDSTVQRAADGGFAGALVDATRWLTGAILILPLIPQLLAPIAQAAMLRFKVALLDKLQGIERRVLALRRDLLDFINTTLRDLGSQSYDLLMAGQFIVTQYVDFYTRVAYDFIAELGLTMRHWLRQASAAMSELIALVEGIRSLLEAFLNFNLTPILLAALGIPSLLWRVLPDPPAFTIDDLLTLVTGAGLIAANVAFTLWLGTLEGVLRYHPLARLLDWASGQNLRERVRALRQILNLTLRPVVNFPAETPQLNRVTREFPDIVEAFFGAGAPDIGGALGQLRDSLRTGVFDMLTAGVVALGDLSTTFAQARDRTGLSPAAFLAIAERANTAVQQLYGPEVDELQRRIAARQDLLAEAFAGAFAQGGFHLLGAVIPGYVERLQQFWAAETERAETEQAAAGESTPPPTSPHILARRAQVGRVRTPRLVVRAPARLLDEGLVDALAVRIKAAVEEAYRTGLEQSAR